MGLIFFKRLFWIFYFLYWRHYVNSQEQKGAKKHDFGIVFLTFKISKLLEIQKYLGNIASLKQIITVDLSD